MWKFILFKLINILHKKHKLNIKYKNGPNQIFEPGQTSNVPHS